MGILKCAIGAKPWSAVTQLQPWQRGALGAQAVLFTWFYQGQRFEQRIEQERLTFFRYLTDRDGSFPFRRFIRDDADRRNLFLMNIRQYDAIYDKLVEKGSLIFPSALGREGDPEACAQLVSLGLEKHPNRD